MKKYFLCILVFILLTGCGSAGKEDDSARFKIYYINKNITCTVPIETELPGGVEVCRAEDEAVIDSILSFLHENTEKLDYVQAIPENVNCTDCYITSDILNICFDDEYYNMDPLREILCRQAIVYTFIQLEDVRAVRIFVGGEALKDADGNLVGLMTADSFVVNPGEQINSITSAELVLYFSSEDGSKLVKEKRTVYYNSNVPLEKLITEQLIAGPKAPGLCAAIPEGTGIANVSVADGVCYISFDNGFENYDYSIKEDIVIYSVVNSLTELSYVDKVQISINGDTSRNYRDDMPLSALYERDLSYLDL